jgi:teichoic acid transport system permease protein
MSDTSSQPAAAAEPSGVEYVFEAYKKSLPPMGAYLRSVWARRRFMVEMARADLRSQYSSTLLGELWAVLDPLIQAGIYFFLFTVIRRGRGGSTSLTDAKTAALIIGCVFLFTFTRNVLGEGGRSIVKSRGLMLNSTFPPLLIPIAAFYKAVLTFLPCTVVYALIHTALGQPVGIGLLYIPVLFVLQAALSLGLAFIAATLTVYVHDMLHVVNYLLRILLFMTPVIYPANLLSPGLQDILRWNPLYPFFDSYQTALTGGTPDLSALIWCTLWAALFLRLGARMFISRERSFALYL